MEQTPQLCGHRPLTTSSVSHSPSRDQAAHEMSLSLQLQVCERAKSIRVSLKSGRVGVCGCRNRRNLAFGPPRMLTIRSSLARAAAQGAAARGGTWSREGSAQSTRRRAFGYSAVGRGHVAVSRTCGRKRLHRSRTKHMHAIEQYVLRTRHTRTYDVARDARPTCTDESTVTIARPLAFDGQSADRRRLGRTVLRVERVSARSGMVSKRVRNAAATAPPRAHNRQLSHRTRRLCEPSVAICTTYRLAS